MYGLAHLVVSAEREQRLNSTGKWWHKGLFVVLGVLLMVALLAVNGNGF